MEDSLTVFLVGFISLYLKMYAFVGYGYLPLTVLFLFDLIQVHFDVPKTMQQISGQLYKRLDQKIDSSVVTEPIGMHVDRLSAADTVADEVLSHNVSESSPIIVSVEPKGTGWPEGLMCTQHDKVSCKLCDDLEPQSRSRAARPDGGPSAETFRLSHPSFVDVPTPLNGSMQPAEAARNPAACHAAFIDLEVGDAASTSSTAVTTTAIGPARLVAPGDAVDSDMASDSMRHHHGRVEWAGGAQGTAPAAAAGEAAEAAGEAAAAEKRIDPFQSSALHVRVAERGLCPGAAQSSSSAEPSVGIAAQDYGKGGAWPAGGACFVCQDAAADAVLIECGHGGLCSGDVLDENTEREGGRRREGYEASSIAESAGLWQPDCAARTLSL